MKKYLFILLALAGVLGASSQQLTVKTYMEKTHVSPKAGTAIGFENKAGIELGGFYQKSSVLEAVALNEAEQVKLPRFYEKEFYGAYMSVPVRQTDKLALKFNIRTGVTNGQNFAITPSILADYSPMRFVKLGLGVGSRSFRPTMQTSITFVLR